MKHHENSIPTRLAQTAAVFILTSILSLLLLSKADSPIPWEDHFQIGQNLRSTGTLTIDGVPSLFRPPGFPGFVAASLWIGDTISGSKIDPSRRSAERDLRIVARAQGVVLGAVAAALFFWASLWSGSVVAASLAIAAALNPYSLAIADVATYHLLFVVLTTLSTLALFLLRRPSMPSGSGALAAGLFWGLTSLVKSVALMALGMILRRKSIFTTCCAISSLSISTP